MALQNAVGYIWPSCKPTVQTPARIKVTNDPASCLDAVPSVLSGVGLLEDYSGLVDEDFLNELAAFYNETEWENLFADWYG